MSYHTYSNDIWDYLQDMPYMPSRSDREYILQKQQDKRLRVWEYFFRIKPDDVGEPQKAEIKIIELTFEQEINKFNSEVENDNSYMKNLNSKTWIAIFQYCGGIVISLITWGVIFYYLRSYFNPNSNFYTNLICSVPFLIFDSIMVIGIIIANTKEFINTRRILENRAKMRSLLGDIIAEGRKRISALICEIDALKQKIPDPHSDDVIKEWLDEELFQLWENSKEKTGLGSRLVSIGFYEADDISKSVNNPLSIMGPGELQDPKNIHPIFKKELSPDYNKHLTARRAYKKQSSDKKDVIYGVYYIEYIAIADDMLATYGLFYDFISGEFYSEKVTEQYYKDVVSINTANEFREIRLGDSNEKILIEDAPTLTLSLSSGEERKVTFVNSTYFWRIKEKLDMTSDEAKDMDLVQISNEMASNAVKALRYHLRRHKGNSMEIEFQDQ